MKKTQNDWISEVWLDKNYQNSKTKNFELLDSYLKNPPKKILDIGCGLAWESRLFNQKYGSDLWLLDGDADEGNQKKSRKSSDANYHASADEFLFYYSLKKLREELDTLGTKNYQLIDCNNISIPPDTKFDLITSWVSCGFHYPISTYFDLIKNHSDENTVICMDIRSRKGNLILEDGVEILSTIQATAKYNTSIIRVK
jgi:hypothetical protein